MKLSGSQWSRQDAPSKDRQIISSRTSHREAWQVLWLGMQQTPHRILLPSVFQEEGQAPASRAGKPVCEVQESMQAAPAALGTATQHTL